MDNSRTLLSSPPRATVVLTSITPWNEIPRLRHQVARQLSRFFNVLWLRLPFHRDGQGAYSSEPRLVHPGITAFEPTPLSRHLLRVWAREPVSQMVINRWVARKVDHLIQDYAPHATILVNFFPWCPQLLRLPRFRAAIYICNDDFAAQLAPLHRWHARLTEHRTVAIAHACLAVSAPIAARFRRWNGNTHLYMPGVELEPDSVCTPPSVPRVDGTTRVCFMGKIDRRLQYSWLEHLVAASPKVHLSLIGPISEPNAVKKLLSLERTQWHPPRFGRDLFDFLSRHDVLVAPYLPDMPGSGKVTIPNKLFQYLATGRPVVMGSHTELLDLPEDCTYAAESADEFARVVLLAHERDTADRCARRRCVAEANSMDERGNWLLKVIENLTR
jgi:glycosyltransferase involved in cell wall biosynthesis